jgi:hypothetical protein
METTKTPGIDFSLAFGFSYLALTALSSLLRSTTAAPGASLYGSHHLFITIAGNHWADVLSMKSPEVRQRVSDQALEVLGLDPRHATAGMLRWLRYPAPKSTLKKPVTYPAIYKEDVHVLPECIVDPDMVTGSWKKKYPMTRKLPPETLHYIQWKRAFFPRSAEEANQQGHDEFGASDCSRSTTVGRSSVEILCVQGDARHASRDTCSQIFHASGVLGLTSKN